MKVLVLSNRVPFVHGGAEELTHHLVRQLRLAGHQAEDVRLPFSWTPSERLYDEMLMAVNLRLSNVDRVIAMKFPAYLVQHHQKVVWLLHQYRQAYDLYDSGMTDIPDNQQGADLRSAIRVADNNAFTNAHRLYAIAESRKRLAKYNRIEAEELSAPLNDHELFTGGEAGNYLFAGGRVNDGKRQSLLIEALQHAPGVRLVIAGPPESDDTAAKLSTLAGRCGVSDRVTLDLRFLPRQDIADLVNNCTAAAYIPFQEDSIGYVTMEAFQAGKPVVTVTDAGGVLDIVHDEETGYVVPPTPEDLGRAMSRLMLRPTRTRRMGFMARQRISELDLTWPKVMARAFGMRSSIAWITPWNERSAIASFSAHVVAELRRRGRDVTILRSDLGAALELPPLGFDGEVRLLKTVDASSLRSCFDYPVANIGNYYDHHGAIPRILDAVPCLGIFHDGFLAHLAHPWSLASGAVERAPILLAEAVYGSTAQGDGAQQRDPEPYWLPLEEMAARKPMLEWLAGMTAGAFVHSEHWAERLRSACPGAVTVHPLSMPDDALPPPPVWGDRLVLATIGHVNANKRAEQVLRALASDPVLGRRCEYRLMGHVEPSMEAHLRDLAVSLGIDPPIFTGWVDDETLRSQMADVHIVFVLRNPVLEAGSASLITAMRSGRPVFVSDQGLYAEIPRDAVMHCAPGEEAVDVARHLRALIEDPSQAKRLGRHAQDYTAKVNGVQSYVDSLLVAIEAAVRVSPIVSTIRTMGKDLGHFGVASDNVQIAALARKISAMFAIDSECKE